MKSFDIIKLKPWELELVQKYPLIFTELDPENTQYANAGNVGRENYVNLRYGFEHKEGWAKLIDEIASVGTALVTDLRSRGLSSDEAYIHSCIVKEKFGTLRWQGNRKLPEPYCTLWDAFVSDVERRSSFTCELTGKYGEVRSKKIDGSSCWTRTLCTEKAIEMGYELSEWEKK